MSRLPSRSRGHDHPGVGADVPGELVPVGAVALDVGVAELLAGDQVPQLTAAFGVDVAVEGVELGAGLLDEFLGFGECRGLLVGELGAAVRIGDQVVLLVHPGEFGLRCGPLPVLGVLRGNRVELLPRELVHEVRVEDRDVVVFEQRVLGLAAGGAVGVEAEEHRGRGVGAGAALADGVAHGVAVQLAGLGEPLEDVALEVGVAGGGERLGGVRVDAAVAVRGDHLVGQVAQADALLHGALGDAEPRRDLLGRRAFAGELAERDHLVGGVHGDAHGVLGERRLRGGVAVDQQARDRKVLRDVVLGGQRLQRAQAPRARGDPVQGLAARDDDEVLEQPVGSDRGDEFRVGLDPRGILGGRAHVALVDAELVRGMSRVSGVAAVLAVGFCMCGSPCCKSGMAEPAWRDRARRRQGRREAPPGTGLALTRAAVRARG